MFLFNINSKIVEYVIAFLFIANVFTIILSEMATNKKLNTKLNLLKEQSKDDNIFKQVILQLDLNIKDDSLVSFNHFISFLEKLNAYPNVTVYSLKEQLTFPTENFDCYFKNILFLDNNTGKYFTYAYEQETSKQESEQCMTKLTIFDIDIDTLEYTPNL